MIRARFFLFLALFFLILLPFKLSGESSDFENQSNLCRNFKVAFQIGHWFKDNIPHELVILKKNKGVKVGSWRESEIMMRIALKSAEMLQKQGIKVEILPVNIPPGYKADAFVALHADEASNPLISGFRVSSSYFDITQKADRLAFLIISHYHQETKMPFLNSTTPAMRYYYAFNWPAIHHSISNQTPAVIIETGFLTNTIDLKILTEQVQLPARGLAFALLDYFNCVQK